MPVQAGIYKYFGTGGELLYIGKAKSLRKRVSSYFVKNHDNYKTRKLVESIHHIEFTIVDSEQDAFLLENSLIKQFQPKFNINLKDDKTYPFIIIKHEPFPRVFLTRRIIKDGSEYLGPFTSVGRVREVLEVIRYNIPLAHLFPEPQRAEYPKREVQGLPRIPPGQLQRPLRRAANAGGLPRRAAAGKRDPARQPLAGAEYFQGAKCRSMR